MNLFEPAMPATQSPDHVPDVPNRDALRMLFSWTRRHNTFLTIAAASVAPVLYVLFVARYATNSFKNNDDWSFVPIVHAALHGQLSLSLLWSQYTESRYFISNLIDVLFGFADRFNQRSVIFLSAALFIAAYGGLLLLVRRYFGRRLTPVPVFVVSVIWFSLADAGNSLWAAHLWGFLTVLFFILMLVALLVPNGRRNLWFVLGLLAAVAASLASLQGFLCWPVGAICILWNHPWAHRARMELLVWIGSTAATIAVYVPGYNFSEGNVCPIRSECTLPSVLGHPITSLQFLVTLIGNVITPSNDQVRNQNGYHLYLPDSVRFEVLGVVLLGAAVYVLIRSWRDRHARERVPLPLLLIVFSLLSDVEITLSRSGIGVPDAVTNRYVLENLILLTGLVIYGLARVPTLLPRVTRGDLRARVGSVALLALAVVVVVQVTTSTQFGLNDGRADQTLGREQAQFFVNLDREVNKSPSCVLLMKSVAGLVTSAGPDAILHDARKDQLGEFQPASYRYYRRLGPWLLPGCQVSRD
jgi:hypothetical protein